MIARLKWTHCKSICRTAVGFIMVLLSGFTHLYAQTSVSMHEGVSTTRQQDSIAIKQMFKRYKAIEKDQSDESIALLREIIAKAKAAGIYRSVFVAIDYLADDLMRRGEYREAIATQLEAIPYAKDPANVPYVNLMYKNLGQAYSDLGKYDTALSYLYKSLESLKGLDLNAKNNGDSATIYNQMGILWSNVGENIKSLNTFKLAEAIATRRNDKEMQGMTAGNIGQVYYGLDSLEKAKLYFNRGRTLAEGDDFHTVVSLFSLAQVASKQGEYIIALKYLGQALVLAHKSKAIASYELAIQAAMGKMYINLGNYKMAKPLILNAYKKATASGQKYRMAEIEIDIARVMVQEGSHKDAYDVLLRNIDNKDSLYQKEKSKSIDVWMAAQMAEKDKAIMLQSLHIAKQRSRLQQKNMWIGGVLLSALLLISFSVPVVRNYRQKQLIQESELLQLQQTQEINQLKAQVRGEEQERKRIAQELHDNIASQLWAINLNIESLQNTDDEDGHRNGIASIFHQLTGVTQGVRKTAHSLMPDLLLEEGLATALASICEKAGRNANIEIDFQEYGLVPAMDKEIELSVYRMVHELIQNALKHARDVTTMLVQLSSVGTVLSITVEDNGYVAPGNCDTVAVVLQQITQRAAALKGHFDLQALPGKGTTAYLEFDLQYLL